MTPKNTICLWFDGTALEAAQFYARTFPDSAVGDVFRAPADFPSGKEGDVLALDIDPLSHPAWTGGKQQVSEGGRVAQFNKRFGGLTLKK